MRLMRLLGPYPEFAPPLALSSAAQLPVPAQRFLQNVSAESYTWILLGTFGFLCGIGLLTSPMMWLKGSQLRKAYIHYGLTPSKESEIAYFGGIAATAFSMLSVVFLLLIFGAF